MTWPIYVERMQRLWVDLAFAQVDAMTTVMFRLPILANRITAHARRRSDREARTMVMEKIDAFLAGARDASTTLARSRSSRTDTFETGTALAVSATRAFVTPAVRRVARNAGRLRRSAIEID